MAIVATASNHMKYMMATKKIDLAGDVLKAILTKPDFTYNKDTHALYTDSEVSAGEIAGGNNGYIVGGLTLQNTVVTEDDVNDKAAFTCTDPSWTAVGNPIGPFGAMIIYDDSTTDKTIICCIDFGVDYTVVPGASFTAQTIKLSLN